MTRLQIHNYKQKRLKRRLGSAITKLKMLLIIKILMDLISMGKVKSRMILQIFKICLNKKRKKKIRT